MLRILVVWLEENSTLRRQDMDSSDGETHHASVYDTVESRKQVVGDESVPALNRFETILLMSALSVRIDKYIIHILSHWLLLRSPGSWWHHNSPPSLTGGNHKQKKCFFLNSHVVQSKALANQQHRSQISLLPSTQQ